MSTPKFHGHIRDFEMLSVTTIAPHRERLTEREVGRVESYASGINASGRTMFASGASGTNSACRVCPLPLRASTSFSLITRSTKQPLTVLRSFDPLTPLAHLTISSPIIYAASLPHTALPPLSLPNMHLPRSQLAQLYMALARSTHPTSPPVLILTAPSVDSLCATRLLAALLRRDYIPHTVQPVGGYAALRRVGRELVAPRSRARGGPGGVVVCLGMGGLVDVEELWGLHEEEEAQVEGGHGVEVWLVDARRPWNLQNVFGGDAGAAGVQRGKVSETYVPGRGGVVVWDDGDVEMSLDKEREAFFELQEMPEIDEHDVVDDEGESELGEDEEKSTMGRKRKASDDDTDADDDDDARPRQRRRSNLSTSIPSSPGGNPQSGQGDGSPPPSSQHRQSSDAAGIPSSPPKPPSQRQLRRRLLRMRRQHEATVEAYYDLGTSYSEPVSSMLYSLASELGREDNDLLWLALVGVSSVDLSPFSTISSSSSSRAPDRAESIREVLRDEVRRLNPIPEAELRRSTTSGAAADGIIPTHARSPTDTAIRLAPEPKFLLIRHWSLYDSMLHSPFLSTRLHVWSDAGRKRLHKLLAKMGVSLQEAGKGYVHMDMEIKRSLRTRILKFADMYNLDGLVPGDEGRAGQRGWSFVRSWGWRATLSAVDVAIVVGAILEVGPQASAKTSDVPSAPQQSRQLHYNQRVRGLPTPPHSEDGSSQPTDAAAATSLTPDWITHRFFAAYDALNPRSTSAHQGLGVLLDHIPTAQHLHRAILRTGSALIVKKQIRHLRSFHMGVVKEGPDVALFTHPGALTKLAAWVGDAVAVLEADKKGASAREADEALVLGCLDETRGVYTVVGLGGARGGQGAGMSRAEMREKEERKKRRVAEKAARKAERARERAQRRQSRREIQEANGLVDSDDEESDETEEEEDDDDDGSESESDAGSDEEGDEPGAARRRKRGAGLNRFGYAFQEVVEQTGARVRIDSFEHSVVEVRKEDLAGFLEALSLRSVVG